MVALGGRRHLKRSLVHVTTEYLGLQKRGGLADYMEGITQELAPYFNQTVVFPILGNTKIPTDRLVTKEKLKVLYLGIYFEFTLIKFSSQDNSIKFIIFSREKGDVNLKNFFAYEMMDDFLYLVWCKAVSEWLKKEKAPDIICTHDWQTAGIYLGTESSLGKAKKIHVIHNYSYPGLISRHLKMDSADLSWENPNALKSMHSIALRGADRILTVSKTYLEELLDEESSLNFTFWLKPYQHKLFAITNGISLTSWSPQNSPYLPHKYGLESIEKRKKYRQYLVTQFDLVESHLIVLFQSRPTSEKGLGNILNEIDQLLQLPITIVFHAEMGPLSCEYFFNLKTLHDQFPKRIILFDRYRESTGHILFSACDILLMPSVHEPCGQLQLYAMQFGLLPVVHKTGGLKETVRDADSSNPTGWHFLIDTPNPIRSILQKVLKTFQDAPATWEQMQREGMSEDRSWGQRLNAYLDLFNFSK